MWWFEVMFHGASDGEDRYHNESFMRRKNKIRNSILIQAAVFLTTRSETKTSFELHPLGSHIVRWTSWDGKSSVPHAILHLIIHSRDRPPEQKWFLRMMLCWAFIHHPQELIYLHVNHQCMKRFSPAWGLTRSFWENLS